MAKLLLLSIALLLLAWLLSSRISHLPLRHPPLVNYDASVYFEPDIVEAPSTKDDIVQIVKYAADRRRTLRVVGSGHSRSPIAYSDSILVSLHHYKGVVHLDTHTKQVTVKAGTLLNELVEFLDKNGLALGNLPAIIEQTVAGVLSTGTHGSGVEFGNLAALVTKLELVTGEGEVLLLEGDSDVFRAALVSVGLLGVITEVTFQCEPAFNLEETMEALTLDNCLDNLLSIAHSAEHVKLWTELFSGSCAVFRMNRTEKEIVETDEMWKFDLKMRLLEPFVWVASWIPSLTPLIMKLAFAIGGVPSYTQVGKSYNVFIPPPYFPENYQAEFVIDMEHCVEGFHKLRRVVDSLHIPANLITELRFVKRDDIWLSPNYQRDSCHLTLMIYNPSEKTKQFYFDSVYQALYDLNFKPRVHFEKYFKVTPEEMRAVYPRFDKFLELRSKLDPHNVFLNDLVAETFGL